jgi:hypothetical protein
LSPSKAEKSNTSAKGLLGIVSPAQMKMRVKKRESVREFYKLLCPGQTRTRVAFMRVDETWQDITMRVAKILINSNQDLNHFKVDEN